MAILLKIFFVFLCLLWISLGKLDVRDELSLWWRHDSRGVPYVPLQDLDLRIVSTLMNF